MVACTAPEGGGRERDAPALSAHAASSTQGQRRCGRKGSTARWGDESLSYGRRDLPAPYCGRRQPISPSTDKSEPHEKEAAELMTG